MNKYISVEMHINAPDKTIILGEDIVEKHTADGPDSPLTGYVDMADYSDKLTDAKAKRKEAGKKEGKAQELYELAARKSGAAEGSKKDDEGTVRWFVGQAEDILRVKNRKNEEAMSAFGFNVVVSHSGGKRTVRIEHPTNPTDMVTLGREIVDEHEELAGASPFVPDDIDMAAFKTLVETCEGLLADWQEADGLAQDLHLQALNIIGYGPSQNIETEGTLYFMNRNIRDRLLQKNQGHEEALNNWGFDVVIRTRKPGRKKNQPLHGTVILVIEVGAAQFKPVETGDIGIDASTPLSVLAQASTGVLYGASVPTNPPGPGATIPLAMGTAYNTTVGQLMEDLAIGDDLPLLMIQNNGLAPGTYRFTFGA